MTFGVSIIVPTCSRPRELRTCLEIVRQQRRELARDLQTELIVTDDSRDDETERLCRSLPDIRYTRGPRRGPAANRNHGARAATGTWLVFLDDDALPRDGWLAALGRAMAQTSCRVLEGKVVSERVLGDEEHAPVNLTGGLLWSCNLAVRRELFASLGGFDEGLRGAHLEDVDLRLRLEAARLPWEFVPEAVVYHPPRKLKAWYQIPWHMEADIYLARKHGLAFARCSANPVVLFRHWLRRALHARTVLGLWKYAGRGCVYALAGVFLTPLWYVKAARLMRRSAGVSSAGREFADAPERPCENNRR